MCGIINRVVPDQKLYKVESYGAPAGDEDVLDLQEDCQFGSKYEGAVQDIDDIRNLSIMISELYWDMMAIKVLALPNSITFDKGTSHWWIPSPY